MPRDVKRLLCVGRLGPDLEAAVAKKAKLLGIEVVIVPDMPDFDVKSAIRRESDLILERLDKSDKVVLFDLEGDRPLSSVDMSSADVFVIGGSNGVDQRVRDRAQCRVSVSKLTFPHGLFRLLALEILESSLRK